LDCDVGSYYVDLFKRDLFGLRCRELLSWTFTKGLVKNIWGVLLTIFGWGVFVQVKQGLLLQWKRELLQGKYD